MFGHADNNQFDMQVSMDYFEELVKAEVANGTPMRRIVFMGDSQGAGMVVLFLQTREIASELGAVISYAGFPATDLKSVQQMQMDSNLHGSWAKETRLFMLHGRDDVFVPIEISQSWLKLLEEECERGEGFRSIDWKLIDDVRHSLSGRVWPYVREILESIFQDETQKPPLKL